MFRIFFRIFLRKIQSILVWIKHSSFLRSWFHIFNIIQIVYRWSFLVILCQLIQFCNLNYGFFDSSKLYLNIFLIEHFFILFHLVTCCTLRNVHVILALENLTYFIKCLLDFFIFLVVFLYQVKVLNWSLFLTHLLHFALNICFLFIRNRLHAFQLVILCEQLLLLAQIGFFLFVLVVKVVIRLHFRILYNCLLKCWDWRIL